MSEASIERKKERSPKRKMRNIQNVLKPTDKKIANNKDKRKSYPVEVPGHHAGRHSSALIIWVLILHSKSRFP